MNEFESIEYRNNLLVTALEERAQLNDLIENQRKRMSIQKDHLEHTTLKRFNFLPVAEHEQNKEAKRNDPLRFGIH